MGKLAMLVEQACYAECVETQKALPNALVRLAGVIKQISNLIRSITICIQERHLEKLKWQRQQNANAKREQQAQLEALEKQDADLTEQIRLYKEMDAIRKNAATMKKKADFVHETVLKTEIKQEPMELPSTQFFNASTSVVSQALFGVVSTTPKKNPLKKYFISKIIKKSDELKYFYSRHRKRLMMMAKQQAAMLLSLEPPNKRHCANVMQNH